MELEDTTSGKTFLTPAQKKRIAFIRGELHDEAGSVHAYVVLAHPVPDTSPKVTVMDPTEAAALIVSHSDGKQFMERTLRVDRVGSKRGDTAGDRAQSLDPRLTVFVGGVDFAAKEEDLRTFFEALLAAEKGVAPTSSWVKSVRIVRDRDTQLGKGFAYVRFTVSDEM